MKRILFIEDEAVLQQTLGDALQLQGYKFLSAMDGAAGLRLAKSELPDLILLDLMLPGKDGFEILEELRNYSKTEHIPVIVLTNLEGLKDIDRVLSAGATTYLVKTRHGLEDVLKKVKESLGE
jgi:DNA-binding response OmpR family regulator